MSTPSLREEKPAMAVSQKSVGAPPSHSVSPLCGVTFGSVSASCGQASPTH